MTTIFDIVETSENTYSALCDGKSYRFVFTKEKSGWLILVNGEPVSVPFLNAPKRGGVANAADGKSSDGKIVSPMPGRVVKIQVTAGQNVSEGDGVVVVEAMKMENEFKAPKSGVVKTVAVSVGDSVEGGAVLVVIE